MEALAFRQVWEALNQNIQWSNTYGPQGEDPLSNKEKGSICAMVTGDCKKLVEEEGDEFFSNVWPEIKRALGVKDWFARGKDGLLIPHAALWKVILAKVKGHAEFKRDGKTYLEKCAQGLLKK